MLDGLLFGFQIDALVIHQLSELLFPIFQPGQMVSEFSPRDRSLSGCSNLLLEFENGFLHFNQDLAWIAGFRRASRGFRGGWFFGTASPIREWLWGRGG